MPKVQFVILNELLAKMIWLSKTKAFCLILITRMKVSIRRLNQRDAESFDNG